MRVHRLMVFLCMGNLCSASGATSESSRVCRSHYRKTNNEHTFIQKSNLSIQEAVNLGLKFRPSYQATGFNVDSFRATQKRELAGFFPQLSMSMSENFENGKKGIGNSTTLQATQLLYDPAGPQATYKIAGKDVEIAKAQYIATQKDVRLEVELAFLSAWLLQEQYNQARSRAVSAKLTYGVAKHSYKEGLLDKNVFLQDRSTFAQNITTASVYQEDVIIAMGELQRTMGTPFRTGSLAWDPETPVCLKKDIQYFIDYALPRRDILKAKRAEMEREQRKAKVSMAKYAPNISLVGSVNRNSFVPRGFPRLVEEVGVSIGWNMFDGLAHYRDYQTSQANVLRATMEKQGLVQQIEQDIKTAYYQVKQGMKHLRAQSATLDQAKNQWELTNQQLAIGTATQTDVEAARFTLEDAKFTWLQNRVTVEKSLRTLLRVSEYPPES